MKKALRRLLCVALVLMLVLTMLPAVSAAGVNKLEAYKAYYEYLQEEIAAIGAPIRDRDYYKMLSKTNPPTLKMERLLGVWLVDFTNDGVEELVIKRRINTDGYIVTKEWVCIYTFENGAIRRIGQNARWAYQTPEGYWGYTEPNGYIGQISSYYDNPHISDECIIVCKGTDGKLYLADSTPMSDRENAFNIYSYNGTYMAKKEAFEIIFLPAWQWGSVEATHGDLYYEVGGTQVNKSGFQSRMNAYTGWGTYELRNNDYTEVLNTLSTALQSYYTPSGWAVAEVTEATEKGYVPANLQENYTKPITRAEFCALAVNLYESEKGVITERMEFDDTTDVNVQKMGALGVVNGVGNNLFAPDAQLTRQQAATMLARLAGAMDSPLPEGPVEFADAGQIASWAYTQVGQVFAAGVMNGVGNNTFAPANSYTREQAILTVLRLSKAI